MKQNEISPLSEISSKTFTRRGSFGVDSGFNNVALGLRLSYQIHREFAPYVGIAYEKSFGSSQDRVQREGGIPNTAQLVPGVRNWF